MPAQITGRDSNNFSLCLEVKIYYPHTLENKKKKGNFGKEASLAESIRSFFFKKAMPSVHYLKKKNLLKASCSASV